MAEKKRENPVYNRSEFHSQPICSPLTQLLTLASAHVPLSRQGLVALRPMLVLGKHGSAAVVPVIVYGHINVMVLSFCELILVVSIGHVAAKSKKSDRHKYNVKQWNLKVSATLSQKI